MVSLFFASALGGPLGSVTATQGQYANTIPIGSFALPYTEVCWVAGARQFDLHPAGGATIGGNCAPGDVGFVVEQDTRGTLLSWDEAREECLLDGMRLLEPFEWVVACKSAATLGLTSVISSSEQWIGSAILWDDLNAYWVSFSAGLDSDCTNLRRARMGALGLGQDVHQFRCAK